METGFGTFGGGPLQVRRNLKIKYSLYEFILDKMGFGQSKRGFQKRGYIEGIENLAVLKICFKSTPNLTKSWRLIS